MSFGGAGDVVNSRTGIFLPEIIENNLLLLFNFID